MTEWHLQIKIRNVNVTQAFTDEQAGQVFGGSGNMLNYIEAFTCNRHWCSLLAHLNITISPTHFTVIPTLFAFP
jgi:hypothetical protein